VPRHLPSTNMKEKHFIDGSSTSRLRKWRLLQRSGAFLLRFTGAFVVLGVQVHAFAQAPAAPASRQQSISVQSVRVEGNTLLPERVLAELTAGVAGSQRSIADLNQVAARIQNAYRDAGYGGVIAYVPEQEISGGSVVIRVVEGKLANVRVIGNVHFDTANVRAGLPNLREGTTPLVRSIDRDIQLTNENPAKEVKVTLTPGARPGEIDAEVDVTESKPLQFLLGYNNSGHKSTGGRHRISVGVQHSNLLGRDHVGTMQYQTSPEKPDQVRIFSVGYRVPLYSQGASFDAFFAHSNVSIGTTVTPAGPLNFAGKGTVLGLRANRNLERVGEYDHRLTLGLDWRDYDNECSLGSFGPAACGSAGVSVTAVPVSIAYTGQRQGPQASWGAHASLSANAGGSSQATFEAARPGARRHYVISRFSAFRDMALARGYAVHGRLDAQYSPHALISAEKFGLGGAATVRGYTERELTGDYGLAARIEALAPAMDPATGVRLRPYLFVDHGRVWNHKGLPCRTTTDTSCRLTGAGIGTRVSIGRNASATVDIGRAFEDGVTTSSGDWRGHVSVSFVF
jgi:hemolysin activation/secretion protein